MIFSGHGFELKNLWKTFGLKQKFIYYWRYFFTEWIYCFPLFRKVMNVFIFRVLDKMHAKRK